MTYFARGKNSVTTVNACVNLASLFYDRKFYIDYQQHAVERIRQLVAQSLAYPLPVAQGDYQIASNFVANRRGSL